SAGRPARSATSSTVSLSISVQLRLSAALWATAEPPEPYWRVMVMTGEGISGVGCRVPGAGGVTPPPDTRTPAPAYVNRFGPPPAPDPGLPYGPPPFGSDRALVYPSSSLLEIRFSATSPSRISSHAATIVAGSFLAASPAWSTRSKSPGTTLNPLRHASERSSALKDRSEEHTSELQSR